MTTQRLELPIIFSILITVLQHTSREIADDPKPSRLSAEDGATASDFLVFLYADSDILEDIV